MSVFYFVMRMKFKIKDVVFSNLQNHNGRYIETCKS